MNKLLFSILMLLGNSAFSQTGADSIRINDLKNQLSNSSGTKKVDLLNDIAWEYGWAASIKDKGTVVTSYVMQAKDLASQLNYKRGIGYALITLSWWRNDNCDSLISAAISIGEKEKDYKLLAKAYHRKWEMKTAFDYYKKAGDIQGEAEAATWLCNEYAGKGQYDNGFNYCQRAIELANIPKTSTPTYSSGISSLAFETMSKLYSKVGDYGTAFQYLKEAEKYSGDVVWAFAEFYNEMGKYDSSVYYYEKALQKQPENGKLWRLVGTANFLAKNYLRAIELLEKGLKGENDPNFKWQLPVNWRGSQHLELALSYHALKNIEQAEKHYLASLKYQQPEYQKIINETNADKTSFQKASQLMDISYGLSKSFYGLHKLDSAYIYQEKYIQYKEQVNNINTISLLNMQLNNYKKAFENEKKTGQIKLLQKDNFIKEQLLQEELLLKQQSEAQLALLDKTNQLKDQQLKQENLIKKQNRSQLTLLGKENKLKDQQLKQQAFIKNALLGGLLLFILLGVFVFRTLSLKRKNEKLAIGKTQAELFQKMSELEMQALRAQMNPHFIFNCLSSINRFILKNEVKDASNYLTRFSRLMRMVLNNSQKPLIALDDELEMLGLYLEMERLRFKNSFEYGITFLNAIDSDNIFIPPLLLQPFCENAIWHGLMHLPAVRHGKERQGRLDIALSMEDNILNCTLTDNGVGREKAEELKSKTAEKEKSLGLKITTERLSLLNHEKGLHTFYDIEDLKDADGNAAGTKVILKISFKESIEEYVS